MITRVKICIVKSTSLPYHSTDCKLVILLESNQPISSYSNTRTCGNWDRTSHFCIISKIACICPMDRILASYLTLLAQCIFSTAPIKSIFRFICRFEAGFGMLHTYTEENDNLIYAKQFFWFTFDSLRTQPS